MREREDIRREGDRVRGIRRGGEERRGEERERTKHIYLGCGWSLLQCSSGPLWKKPVALTQSFPIFSSISIKFRVLLQNQQELTSVTIYCT